MSIRTKLGLIVILSVVALATFQHAMQRILILPRFDAIEQAKAKEEVDRCAAAFNREVDHLNTLCLDWSAWDDAYRFAEDRNEAFIKSNIETLGTIGLNLTCIYNNKGQVVLTWMRDGQTVLPMDLPEFPDKQAPPGHPLLAHKELEGSIAGMIMTNRGLMMIASRPITTSEKKGPSHGTFIMGKFVNDAFLANLKQVLRLEFDALPLQRHEVSLRSNEIASSAGASGSQVVVEDDKASLVGYAVVRDLGGKPVLLIRRSSPRDILREGQKTLHLGTVSTFGGGVALALLILWLIHRAVTRPLAILTHHATVLGQGGDLSRHLSLNRGDEVGTLARTFDWMTDQLLEREHLRVQSEERYRTLVENLPIGVYRNTPGPQGRFIMANPTLARMFGLESADELSTVRVCEHYFDPAERSAFSERLIAQGQVVDQEIRMKRKDGTPFWASVTAKVLRNAAGEIECFDGLIEDITQRRQMEEERAARLGRAQRQQAAIVSLATDVDVNSGHSDQSFARIVEVAANTLAADRASVWLFDTACQEMQCQALYERSRGRLSKGAVLPVAPYPNYFRAITTGRFIDAQYAETDPRTQEFAEGYLKPLGISSMLDAPVRIMGRVLGVVCIEHVGPSRAWHADEVSFTGEVADQVAQVLMNRERTRTTEALVANEALLKSTLESTADGILVVDSNGHVTHTNARFAEMWHIPENLLKTQDDRTLLQYVLDQLTAPEAFIEKVESLSTTTDASFDTLRFKDGRIFERYSCPLMQEGRHTGRVWSFSDVSERRRAQEALQESQRILATLMSNLPGMAYRCRNDAQWTMEFVSDGCLELTGYCPEDLLHNNVISYARLLYSEEESERLRQKVDESLKARKAFQTTYRIRAADGTVKWVWEKGGGSGPPMGRFWPWRASLPM